jgi:hypothetical protein
MPDLKKLDNPAWHALNERHARFSFGTDAFRRYDPSVVLFSGYDKSKANAFSRLNDVFSVDDSFFLFDDFPELPSNYKVETIVECVQMVCETPVPIPITEELVLLNESNRDEMYTLISEVFPGYYLSGTAVMGDYYGIFKEGKLVAIAGERLCMDDLTEISAVVTHPDFAGRKYAQQLVTFLNDKNIQSGYMPFLHTGS